MSEFTKGPWRARHPLDMEGMHHIFIYGADNKKLGRIDGHVDGKCCGEKGFPDRAETIANAHLIASAPAMYEALKEIKKIAGTIPGKPTLQASEIWDIIRPLVDKAEGKTK